MRRAANSLLKVVVRKALCKMYATTVAFVAFDILDRQSRRFLSRSSFVNVMAETAIAVHGLVEGRAGCNNSSKIAGKFC